MTENLLVGQLSDEVVKEIENAEYNKDILTELERHLFNKYMYTKNLLWEANITNKRLRLLAEGCSDHPSYRAKRKPSADCERCLTMWQVAQELSGNQ